MKTIVLCELIIFIAAFSFAQISSINQARTQWIQLLTGGSNYDAKDPQISAALKRSEDIARNHWKTLDTSPNRTALWSDLRNTGGEDTGSAVTRLKSMALAFASKGGNLEGNTSLSEDIADGLDWINRNRYNETTKEEGNWWWWEIGIPNHLLDTMVLLGKELSPSLNARLTRAILRFVPDPTYRTNLPKLEETGANRADKAYITARRGIVSHNTTAIEVARDALTKIFDYVTTGDGFYTDGSFIQHGNFAYTGTYGEVLLESVAGTMNVLRNTTWAVSVSSSNNVFKWMFDSFEPVAFRGQTMAHVRGRAISRGDNTDFDYGQSLVGTFCLLHPLAPSNLQSRIAAFVREMVDSSAKYNNYTTTASVSQLIAYDSTIKDSRSRRGDLVLHKTFANMDRIVHHRPGYSFSISARSSRIADYESGNGENLKGWYTGEGMTYLYNHELSHYTNGFWPTADMYRLAGTTTATEETFPRSANDNKFSIALGDEAWVGGITLYEKEKGGVGAFGMRFKGLPDKPTGKKNTLVGTKSWFMEGDVVVALGAGISANGVKVQTTVENRMVQKGSCFLSSENDGNEDNTNTPSWAHLNEVAGYLFPRGGNLQQVCEDRTGKWSTIHPAAPPVTPDQITRRYATLWLDHGGNPQNATYEYYILPGSSKTETAKYLETVMKGGGIQIVRNTPQVQAVNNTESGILSANFFAAGKIGIIEAQQACSVAVDMKAEGGGTLVAVSDPTMKLSQVVILLEGRHTATKSDDKIKVDYVKGQTRIAIDTAQARGKTFSISLKKQNDV
ncbi:uncharacterized protein VTP21DRAFT_2300 [Calcarisporiella thermophila]|uniref:uncharacterized protein n=1 Tax=Calcarisporiella thermophila TaxID=911321 RepID=UPI003742A06D